MEIEDEKKAVRFCARCGTENGRLDHRCKSCNARMQTRPGYVMPEPGDENLSLSLVPSQNLIHAKVNFLSRELLRPW